MTFLLALLFAGLFGGQGIVLPNQGGTISGLVRDASGKPAVRVRVSAVTQPEKQGELAEALALASLAETDEAGRFRLENVPPGRYYIAAGRVDFPTYYPGTQALGRATVVAITPGAVVNGIDFPMQDSSARVFGPELSFGVLTFSVPVKVTVEGGGKLPVFSPNGFLLLRLTNVATGVQTDEPISVSTINAAGATSEFSVSVVNLPQGYSVKSTMAGTTDITKSTLKLGNLNFSGTTATTPFGPAQIFPAGAMASTVGLSITLSRSGGQDAASSGVQVTGRAPTANRRSIYISGRPGLFYSDGTFEFRGVPPGRHSIATLYNAGAPGALAASVVVGTRDVENVELEHSAMLPFSIRDVAEPGPSGTYPAGARVRLASLHVAVVDGTTKEPATPGTVFILGPSGTSFDLPEGGRFEMLHLLPGEYRFEVQAFGHPPVVKSVSMGDEDVTLELTVQ